MFARLNAAIKSSGRATLALTAAALLAACEPIGMGGLAGGPPIDTSRPVPVALLVPGTGASGGDAVLSRNLENAARLAMADLKGVDIDLSVYSTGGNEAGAQSAAARAVNGGAAVILGPLYSASANAAGVVAAQAGINVLAFSNNAAIAGGNVFVLGPTFQNTANRLTGFAARQGRSRIVIAHADNVAGQTGAAAIRAAAGRAGLTVVDSVPYQLSQPGVVSAVPRIKAAIDAGAADALFLTANSDSDLPLLSQLLPEQGVTNATAQFVGITRWDIPQQSLALPGLQGGWFALPDPNRSAQFAARYQAAYGTQPNPIAGLAYDGIAAIGALAAQGRGLGADDLTQGAGFQGTGGPFRLQRNGTSDRALAVAEIRNGRVNIITPAPGGFGGAGF